MIKNKDKQELLVSISDIYGKVTQDAQLNKEQQEILALALDTLRDKVK
jgi:hypothetical protein